MGFTIGADTVFKSGIMIVYKRDVKKEDVYSLDEDEELIYYYNNNIAYSVNQLYDGNYIIRKKKIFNNELMEERKFKTVEQIVKFIPDCQNRTSNTQ